MQTRFTLANIELVKGQLQLLLPYVKSSHRVEAMARGLGWQTNAALRADLAVQAVDREPDHKPFAAYLAEQGFGEVEYGLLDEAVVRGIYPEVLAQIRVVMEADVGLTHSGYRYFSKRMTASDAHNYKLARDGMLTATAVAEFLKAKAFLETANRGTRLFKGATSYGLKHDAERFHDRNGVRNPYVSNGMFIVAAKVLGFSVRQAGDSPNAWLNIAFPKEKAPQPRSKAATAMGGKQRIAAYKNMVTAAVNAGLAQGHFTLEPGSNRFGGDGCVYRFELAGRPAMAYVRDIDGMGELIVNVAVNPTERAPEALQANFAGFHAGEAFANGFFEREVGKWVQVPAKPVTAFRRDLLVELAALSVQPNGFRNHGRMML